MKLNSHAREVIVNVTFTLDELQHIQQYIQYLANFGGSDGGFNPILLASYNKQLSNIIQEVERHA